MKANNNNNNKKQQHQKAPRDSLNSSGQLDEVLGGAGSEPVAPFRPSLHRQKTFDAKGMLLRGPSFMCNSIGNSPASTPQSSSKGGMAATTEGEGEEGEGESSAMKLLTEREKKLLLVEEEGGGGSDDPAIAMVREVTMLKPAAAAIGGGSQRNLPPKRRKKAAAVSEGGGSSSSLVPKPQEGVVYTIVLDLDETLVYARDGPLYARAHLKHFFKACEEAKNIEIIVWTAGERKYAKSVVREINYHGIIKHLIYRRSDWFDSKDYTKELARLGREMDYVLIIENTPDCVRENPENGIIVEDYEGEVGGEEKQRRQDKTLLFLSELVGQLGSSGLTVPKFLAQSNLLKRQRMILTVGSEEDNNAKEIELPLYYVSKRRRGPSSKGGGGGAGEEKKEIKVNRDKQQKPPTTTPPEEDPTAPPATVTVTAAAAPNKRARSTPPPPPPTAGAAPQQPKNKALRSEGEA